MGQLPFRELPVIAHARASYCSRTGLLWVVGGQAALTGGCMPTSCEGTRHSVHAPTGNWISRGRVNRISLQKPPLVAAMLLPHGSHAAVRNGHRVVDPMWSWLGAMRTVFMWVAGGLCFCRVRDVTFSELTCKLNRAPGEWADSGCRHAGSYDSCRN
jgi:hypothetical protein